MKYEWIMDFGFVEHSEYAVLHTVGCPVGRLNPSDSFVQPEYQKALDMIEAFHGGPARRCMECLADCRTCDDQQCVICKTPPAP